MGAVTYANTGTRRLTYAFDDYRPGAKTINGTPMGNGNLWLQVGWRGVEFNTVELKRYLRVKFVTSLGAKLTHFIWIIAILLFLLADEVFLMRYGISLELKFLAVLALALIGATIWWVGLAKAAWAFRHPWKAINMVFLRNKTKNDGVPPNE